MTAMYYFSHLQCMSRWEISHPNLFLFQFFTFFWLNFVGWHIFMWCHVGIDYLSVASYDYLIPSHLVFLKDRVRKSLLLLRTDVFCFLFYPFWAETNCISVLKVFRVNICYSNKPGIFICKSCLVIFTFQCWCHLFWWVQCSIRNWELWFSSVVIFVTMNIIGIAKSDSQHKIDVDVLGDVDWN